MDHHPHNGNGNDDNYPTKYHDDDHDDDEETDRHDGTTAVVVTQQQQQQQHHHRLTGILPTPSSRPTRDDDVEEEDYDEEGVGLLLGATSATAAIPPCDHTSDDDDDDDSERGRRRGDVCREEISSSSSLAHTKKKKGIIGTITTTGDDYDTLLHRWSALARVHHRRILLFWFGLVWPLGLVCTPLFVLYHTTMDCVPPHNSKSYNASMLFREGFGLSTQRWDDERPLLILLEQQQEQEEVWDYDEDEGYDLAAGNNSRIGNDNNNGTTTRVNKNNLVDGHSELYKSTRDFVLAWTDDVERWFNDTIQDVIPSPPPPGRQRGQFDSGRNDGSSFKSDYYVKVKSYYGLERDGLAYGARRTLVKDDGRVTLISVEFALPDDKRYKRQFLRHVVRNWEDDDSSSSTILLPPPDGVRVRFASMDLFQQETIDGVLDDIFFMDEYIGPIAMLILALVLGNLPIMIIPCLTIATSTLASGVIMLPLTTYVLGPAGLPVGQFTPGMMTSLTIALSIDYSLFLLTRCSEEVMHRMQMQMGGGGSSSSMGEGNGKSSSFVVLLEAAVEVMVVRSGHTIIVSGITLCGCCAGLMLIPVGIIATVGLGAIASVLTTLLVNLSLTPALLFTPSFGEYLLRPNRWQSMLCCNKEGNPGRMTAAESGRKGNSRHFPMNTKAVVGGWAISSCPVDDEMEEMKGSVWYRMGKIFLHPWKGPLILALVVVVGTLPVARYSLDLTHAIDPSLMVPRNSTTLESFNTVGRYFGKGAMSPHRIVVDGRTAGMAANSKEAFQVMHNLIESLSNRNRTKGGEFSKASPLSSFNGISALAGRRIPHAVYDTAMRCGLGCKQEAMRNLAWASTDTFLSADNMTTVLYVVLNVDPWSTEGIQWLSSARKTIQSLSDGGELMEFDVAVEGLPGQVVDLVDAASGSFATVVCATFVAVFLLMSWFFQSVVIPLLSIASISLTQAFVYGLVVLVYQRGALDVLGVASVASSGSIYWLPPILNFTIIVGLGLDYDIFLLSRIEEYRMRGFTHEQSILAAMYKTRGIITAAGIIMAVALGGLLHSGTTMVNQTAFMLASAVLMDTFVIRIVVVPILMGMLGRYAWWPRTMPKS